MQRWEKGGRERTGDECKKREVEEEKQMREKERREKLKGSMKKIIKRHNGRMGKIRWEGGERS